MRRSADHVYLLPLALALTFLLVPSFNTALWVAVALVAGLGSAAVWQVVDRRRELARRLGLWSVLMVVMTLVYLIAQVIAVGTLYPSPAPGFLAFVAVIPAGVILTEQWLSHQERPSYEERLRTHAARRAALSRRAGSTGPATPAEPAPAPPSGIHTPEQRDGSENSEQSPQPRRLSAPLTIKHAPHGDTADFIEGKINAVELMRRLRRRNGLPDRDEDGWLEERVDHDRLPPAYSRDPRAGSDGTGLDRA